ncbi:hypothetical protein TCAL_00988 [Tigriopus californicus]|uniref:Acireductone dioxygenase n=1 Tax=Tigriopus californicus TaxID=6832 RepID=A0A553P1M9_TIGCA|nr:acireductone dioxygenase-like [Tigriopus californicus]TRY71599.1 hypothetical protein TCAL_00988 [Tigriopus californicus]|eukprot:TCALIF_00988-PA protein Name:"Similar to IscW_ISCW007295 1,2-dihydroxy-3-keto-5-methylthiopentene dioxygenase (Ixodes scapularis)" AED:0.31 eAED:0.31 QI:136/1/1/1/1/1/3/70/190
MSRAWYMNDLPDDQRLERQMDPPQPVEISQLRELTGVTHYKLNPATLATDGVLEGIKQDRGYNYEDCCEISKGTLPDYEVKIKNFFTEHIHTDEEIRFVEKGSGYFDVRDKNDRWIRIECLEGDLIILPAGIYHRFTLDMNNYIKARRFFCGEPIWTPHNRPADHFKERQSYVSWMKTNFQGEPALTSAH